MHMLSMRTTYLSGNLSLSNLDTTTDYWFPSLSLYFDWWKSKNEMGSVTLFPSWLEHKVDPNTTSRILVLICLPNMPWIMFRKTVWKMRKTRILFCCQKLGLIISTVRGAGLRSPFYAKYDAVWVIHLLLLTRTQSW